MTFTIKDIKQIITYEEIKNLWEKNEAEILRTGKIEVRKENGEIITISTF